MLEDATAVRVGDSGKNANQTKQFLNNSYTAGGEEGRWGIN